jgi:uridine kinase
MIINKDGINKNDQKIAFNILHQLRNGDRVFGSPAEGLKKTLKSIEESNTTTFDHLSFKINDSSKIANIAKLKAGITGEETLASYIENIIKYNKKLDGLVVFASLSKPEEKDKEYDYSHISDSDVDCILDTDFIAICGRNLLILDAKNIHTSPEIPIFIDKDNNLKAMSKILFQIHSSTYVWQSILKQYNIQYDTINEYVVLVNHSGCVIWKNDAWYQSQCKPIYIGDLNNYLEEWMNQCSTTTTYLDILTAISKTQIRQEHSDIDLSNMKRRFKL